MKRQIRRNIFETNSSSTHSLTMCSEEEFEQWKNGKVLFDEDGETFVKQVNYQIKIRNLQLKSMRIIKMSIQKIGQNYQRLRKKDIIQNMRKRMIL